MSRLDLQAVRDLLNESQRGTRPEWRGRGIATALIMRSMHAFAEAGLTHASIGVDSDSVTGAARLYRSLGFEPEHHRTTWEIEVTRPA